MILHSYHIDFKFGKDHYSLIVVLCANLQNDLTTNMNVLGE